MLQVVKILEQVGVALGEPYSSALEGTKHPLRESRPQAGEVPGEGHLCVRPKA